MTVPNHFDVNRRRCLQDAHAETLGDRFAPPWFDPMSWQFTETGELHGTLEEGLQTEGYRQLVHGGAIAALIDAAMTHCLFGHGIVALTAELKVHYRKPLLCKRSIQIQTGIEQVIGDQLYRLKARVMQEHETRTEAFGAFFRPLPGDPGSTYVCGTPPDLR